MSNLIKEMLGMNNPYGMNTPVLNVKDLVMVMQILAVFGVLMLSVSLYVSANARFWESLIIK